MKELITRFDLKLTTLIQALPRRLKPLMKAASLLGEPVMSGLLLILVIVAAVSGHFSHQVIAYVVAILALPVASVVKLFVKRTRPVSYVPTTRLRSHSFPSGHSYGSFLALGLIAWISGSVIVMTFALSLIILVGISRIYLGAHFPSDVVGGWIMAKIVVITIIIMSGLS